MQTPCMRVTMIWLCKNFACLFNIFFPPPKNCFIQKTQKQQNRIYKGEQEPLAGFLFLQTSFTAGFSLDRQADRNRSSSVPLLLLLNQRLFCISGAGGDRQSSKKKKKKGRKSWGQQEQSDRNSICIHWWSGQILYTKKNFWHLRRAICPQHSPCQSWHCN